MTKTMDQFCGYLNVGEDTFTYNVLNHVVTLLPAQDDPKKIDEVLERMRSRKIDSPEFLFGICNNHKIAMQRTGEFSMDLLQLNPSIQFGAPLIIKSYGNMYGFYHNLTQDWDKYHAITFYGGNINALYDPRRAVEPQEIDDYKKNRDGAWKIKIRPWNQYTHLVNLEIDGEKATLTISVSQTGEANNSKKMEAYDLGELNSFMRLDFENAQGFDKIKRYYGIIKSVVELLTMRRNVFFEVYLSQRNRDNLYFKTGICKIFDDCKNYSKRKWCHVISIDTILDSVPKLIEKIANNEVEPLRALLPKDNQNMDLISITNIQDLCTALERAYDWSKRSQEKDFLMEELKKNIKETIDEFSKIHNEIDVYKRTTISSAFQYLDYTLKQKILTLYDENCDAINAIISKWSLPPINEASVGSFVKIRNSKTHSGIVEWGDSANLYSALLALVYACLFRYIGVPDETIKSELLKIF